MEFFLKIQRMVANHEARRISVDCHNNSGNSRGAFYKGIYITWGCSGVFLQGVNKGKVEYYKDAMNCTGFYKGVGGIAMVFLERYKGALWVFFFTTTQGRVTYGSAREEGKASVQYRCVIVMLCVASAPSTTSYSSFLPLPLTGTWRGLTCSRAARRRHATAAFGIAGVKVM